MATIQTCALSSRITSYEFGELESRAVELAGGKDPTNKHYIAAAQDLIATRQSWIEQINKALGKKEKADAVQEQGAAEVPARAGAGGGSTVGEEVPGQGQPAGEGQAGGETPAAGEVAEKPKKAAPRAAQVNRDLTANVPETLGQEKARTEKRRDDYIASGVLELVDDATERVNVAIDKGDYDLANSIMDELQADARGRGRPFYDSTSKMMQDALAKLSAEQRGILRKRYGSDYSAMIDDAVAVMLGYKSRTANIPKPARDALRAHANALLSTALFGEGTRYSGPSRTPPANSMSRQQLESIVSDVETALGGKADVLIFNSETDVNPDAEPGAHAGALIDGRVHLFLDGIENGSEGLKTVFHELLHKGLRNLLPGPKYRSKMLELYNNDPTVQKLADKWLNGSDGRAELARQQKNGVRGAALRDAMQAVAADEALASLAERTKLEPGLLRRLGNWLAGIADAIGMKRLAQMVRGMGVSQLQLFVQKALRASVQGTPEASSTRFSSASDKYVVEGRPGANVVRMARLLGPKLYGSPQDLQNVSIKEIFQNSFDAIKALIDKGQITKGRISIRTDGGSRTISVLDNGSGMSPDVLANQFLQIAGTFKETERSSGGLGIAKMLFLFANESLDVITARDGKVSRLSTSGKDLMSALDGSGVMPKISVGDLSDSDKKTFPEGRGTLIKVKVPETYVDPSDNEEKEIPFRVGGWYHVLTYSPLFSDIDVSLDGDDVSIGSRFPAEDYTPFANVSFEWGDARIYVSKEEQRLWSQNAHVLSNGLWQFSLKLTPNPLEPYSTPIQRTFFIDASPRVRPEDPGYPFDLNRQQFSKAAESDFTKIFRYISVLYRADALSTEVASFGSLQYIDKTGGRIVATSPTDLAPNVPQEGVLAQIKEGDTVEVREGSLIVNGRVVPELTRKDLEKANIDIDSLRIDQSSIDPDRIILHDNLEVKGELEKVAQAKRKLADATEKLAEQKIRTDLAGERAKKSDQDEDEKHKLEITYVREIEKKWALEEKVRELEDELGELDRNAPWLPVTEAANAKFGDRFYEYVHGIGDTLRTLRDLVADIMDYPELKREGMGISFDKEYRGVSIRLPFAGMFINPAVPEFTDPARAAYGMFGTMVHEFAHHRVRSHNAEFPAEMQRILIQLDAQDKVDVVKMKRDLVSHVKKYEDVLLWLHERNTSEDSKPRGRRFKDGNEQSRSGGDAGDVGSARQGAERRQGVSGRPVQGGRAGEAGTDAGSRRAGGTDGQPVGNRGTYDPTNPDIRYRTARGSVEAMGDVLKVDGMVKARRAVLSASFLRDIRARFGSGKNEIAGVEDFAKATFDMSAAAAEIQEEGTKVFDALNSLSTKEKTDVTELMADATSSMVYAEGDNSHLGEQAQIEAGKLQARFKAFNDKQKRAYRLARDALKANWEKRGRLLAAKVNEVYTPLINAARAAGDDRKVRTLERQRADFLREQNEALSSIRGDYFPLMRFGEYVVVRKSTGYNELSDKVDKAYKYLDKLLDEYETRTPEERKAIARANKKLKGTPSEFDAEFTEEQAEELKAARQVYQDLRKKLEAMKSDPNQYYMAQFDTLAEAEADAARVKGTALLKRERTRELSPVSRAMLEQVNESITAEMRATGNVAALREARQALYQVFLTSMPERSALLRQAKRKYVAGFSRDMERSVISSILTDSFYLSRMEHADRITEALNRVWSDSETKGVPAQEVARELQRRLILSMRYTDTPIQDAITGVTYAWLLGVSPGYLIANLTQPFLVSLPKLWSRHGMRSNAVFGKALGDASRMVSKHAGSLLRGELRLEDSGLPANEAALLQDMLRERLLSVTLVSDLARTADGKAVSRFTSLVARPGHVVEMVNRISTALAAYRLERGKGRSDADAKAYAVEVLADTHFDYSAENAPYWMKPGALPGNKLFFQFKKYQLGMISLLAKTLVTAAKGDKVPKAEARRMIFGVLATHMAVGGMIGLPAFGTMAFLANMVAAAFGDDEEPWDARVALRNYLYDSFGPEIGNVLAKGLPTILGADMSQKTGLGDVLNPLPTVREDKEGRDFYLELLAAGMGPFFGGIAPRAFDAANQLAAGNFVKGAEGLLPKWMADPIKAGRFAEEGVTTRKGTVALPRDQLDAADIFLQSIGIPAQQITDAYEARAAVEGVKATLNERIGRLKNRWVDAKLDGDNAAAQDIWEEIRDEVNPVRRRNGLEPVTLSDLIQFQRQRGKTEQKYRDLGTNAPPAMAEIGRFAR